MRNVLSGWRAFGMLVMLLGAGSPCQAQSQPAYPTKPIRIIVPMEPGGTTEVLGRLLSQKMMEFLGQRIVIETRPGAAGNIGTAAVAHSAPDGYTLLCTSLSPLVINIHTYAGKFPYDPEKDLVPISVITKVPTVLTTYADFPQRTVKDLIAYAKANPGKLSYGSSGTGSFQHLLGEMFKVAAGINLLHVPYKGAGQGVTALLSKEVDMILSGPPAVLSNIRSKIGRASCRERVYRLV
jgi:tripartite-type tricarboxylate transporter receptor subunit TctC